MSSVKTEIGSANPAAEPVAFTKAEANGNDFLIIDGAAVDERLRAAFVRSICDRHLGVGADGVEWLSRDHESWKLELSNADGTPAEISGNGTRCVAAYLAERHGFTGGTLQTGAGPRAARVESQTREGWQIELEMGRPAFDVTAVPAHPPAGVRELRDWPMDLPACKVSITALSMGNPQCCLFVHSFPHDWIDLGAAIESHSLFPQHTNVEFVRLIDQHTLELRIFERGVGPTQSSGTGSCAAAVAAIATGRAASPITVLTPGGQQRVTWNGDRVILLGPARLVASGEFFWNPASAL
jgi:diaminopimelate epimerase